MFKKKDKVKKTNKKNVVNSFEKDSAILMECMEKAISGDFSSIDASLFENKETAEKYNELLLAFTKSKEEHTDYVNSLLTQIPYSNAVKNVTGQIYSETFASNDMKESSQNLGNSIQTIETNLQGIQANCHGVMNMSSNCIDGMRSSINIIDESSEQISGINEQIGQFTEKAVKINEILDIVKKVAQKSGLLALNASIEAARAGEAGKGFAVVANQIKELSANTTSSTENVVMYVNELMDGISALTESIESTTSYLKEGNESIHKSLDDMFQISESLGNISNDFDGIYDEINTQSALTQSFVASIDSMANGYENLTDSCKEIEQYINGLIEEVNSYGLEEVEVSEETEEE